MRELTGRELDAVGGGFFNANNWGSITFNNTGGAGGAGGAGGLFGDGGNGGAGGSVNIGAQIGQQFNLLSLNGFIG